MPLHSDEKNLVFSHIGKPMVGLIHKHDSTIVLAPCISQKVSLDLNEKGEAKSGTRMSDNVAINNEYLDDINALLRQNHVPRLACTFSSPFEEKSSHEFLFKQKCGGTYHSEWGGFALTLDASGEIEYAFVSGAFNSNQPGKRIKGASLSQELIHKVKQETAVLGRPKRVEAEIEGEEAASHYETPPKKRQCLYDGKVGGIFSSADCPPIACSLEPEVNSFESPGA
ncbi:MAG: hypothetical protein P1U36_06910 [Legionellaceae bacterium]|nr:hypothetical protein [Legionellaceae bacterium]